LAPAACLQHYAGGLVRSIAVGAARILLHCSGAARRFERIYINTNP
jgi:hypothetical protein